MQSPALTYAIKFVGDMEAAVEFYRDVLGLPLKFQSPGWSSFITGGTTLALHPASAEHPPGSVELGFTVENIETAHSELKNRGVTFMMPPTQQDFGRKLAVFRDSEGASCSLGEAQKQAA